MLSFDAKALTEYKNHEIPQIETPRCHQHQIARIIRSSRFPFPSLHISYFILEKYHSIRVIPRFKSMDSAWPLCSIAEGESTAENPSAYLQLVWKHFPVLNMSRKGNRSHAKVTCRDFESICTSISPSDGWHFLSAVWMSSSKCCKLFTAPMGSLALKSRPSTWMSNEFENAVIMN